MGIASTLQGSRLAAVNDAGRVIGADHHTAKLSDEDIDLIFALREQGLSYSAIARKFDCHPRISKSHVHNIITGKRRAQLAKGQRRVRINPRLTPAAPEEFEP